MIEAIACAKVNYSLRVGPVHDNGLHRVGGLFQSISWVDRLTVEWSEADGLESLSGGPVIDGRRNLVWQATELVRQQAENRRPIRIGLGKSIPAAAGLGGGSADGAAALAVVGRMCGVDATPALASRLGSDVPFCLHGGAVEVGGTGETLAARPVADGFVLGVVVPPIELSTAAVFDRWDAMGGPTGTPPDPAALPPSLRDADPLTNDLHPAAAAVAPVLEDWRHELAAAWGRPVLLTGSGPALFAFFVDPSEAAAALDVVPAGARATAVAEPTPFGWAARDDSTTWSYRPIGARASDLAARLLDG